MSKGLHPPQVYGIFFSAEWLFYELKDPLPDSVRVALLTLTQSVWVRILVRQPRKTLEPQWF